MPDVHIANNTISNKASLYMFSPTDAPYESIVYMFFIFERQSI